MDPDKWTQALIILFLIGIQVQKGYGGATLSAPPAYTIFGGEFRLRLEWDAEVESEFQNSSNFVLDFGSDRDNKTFYLLTAQVTGPSPQFITVQCGLIDVPGHHRFRLLSETQDKNEGYLLAQTDPVYVKWPHVLIETSHTLETYSTDVTAYIQTFGVACTPKGHSIETWISLLYLGADPQNMILPLADPVFVSSLDFFHSTANQRVVVQCEFFERPGTYQLLLQTNASQDYPLATSHVINVLWSDKYSLLVESKTIYPCVISVSVFYQHPKCIFTKDKIRLLGRRKLNVSSTATPTKLEYLAERRISSGHSMVHFACEHFSKKYVEFCFKYVSMTRQGQVSDVITRCVPAVNNGTSSTGNDIGSAEWTSWSSWSRCTGLCNVGSRHRHRFCTQTSQISDAESFCQGSAFMSQPCLLTPCEVNVTSTTSTPSPVDSATTKQCTCGCTIHVGRPYQLAHSSKRCLSSAAWILQSDQGSRLKFSIIYLDLLRDNEWMRIRDGGSTTSDLLLTATGDHSLSTVYTSGPLARLEFYVTTQTNNLTRNVTLDQNRTKPKAGKGFIITIELMDEIVNASSQSIKVANQNAARAVVIGIFILILASAIILVIFNMSKGGNKLHHDVSMLNLLGPSCSQGTLISTLQVTSMADICEAAKIRVKKKGGKKTAKLASEPKCKKSKSKERASPEDFLDDSHLFSPVVSVQNSPAIIRKNANKLKEDFFKQDKDLEKGSDKSGKLFKSGAYPVVKLRTKLPPEKPKILASLSEFSLNEVTEDYEYDYYDYAVHNCPGSYLSNDAGVLSYLPPFLPPPVESEDVQMVEFPPQQSLKPSPIEEGDEIPITPQESKVLNIDVNNCEQNKRNSQTTRENLLEYYDYDSKKTNSKEMSC